MKECKKEEEITADIYAKVIVILQNSHTQESTLIVQTEFVITPHARSRNVKADCTIYEHKQLVILFAAKYEKIQDAIMLVI